MVIFPVSISPTPLRLAKFPYRRGFPLTSGSLDAVQAAACMRSRYAASVCSERKHCTRAFVGKSCLHYHFVFIRIFLAKFNKTIIRMFITILIDEAIAQINSCSHHSFSPPEPPTPPPPPKKKRNKNTIHNIFVEMFENFYPARRAAIRPFSINPARAYKTQLRCTF